MEQNASKALEISDRAYVLGTGSVPPGGTGKERANSPEAQKAYVGVKIKHPLHTIVQGVFFMCRRNQLLGCALLAFGFGLLVGTWLESGLFCCLFGLDPCADLVVGILSSGEYALVSEDP